MDDVEASDFITAAKEAQSWVRELAAELRWEEARAYGLLRSVLHGLRDQLSAEDTATLASHLPVAVRGILFEGWTPRDARTRPAAANSLEIRLPSTFFGSDEVDLDAAISAAVSLLGRHLSEATRAA
jgi:uncharacterized protein (DUF2267 family)